MSSVSKDPARATSDPARATSILLWMLQLTFERRSCELLQYVLCYRGSKILLGLLHSWMRDEFLKTAEHMVYRSCVASKNKVLCDYYDGYSSVLPMSRNQDAPGRAAGKQQQQGPRLQPEGTRLTVDGASVERQEVTNQQRANAGTDTGPDFKDQTRSVIEQRQVSPEAVREQLRTGRERVNAGTDTGPDFKDQTRSVIEQRQLSPEAVREQLRTRREHHSQQATGTSDLALSDFTPPLSSPVAMAYAFPVTTNETADFSDDYIDETLIARIRNCQNIKDFETIYQDMSYQMKMERIVKAQSGAVGFEQLEAWAKAWALDRGSMDHNSMRFKNAFRLDADRRACLELLKVLSGLYWNKQGQVIPDSAVTKDDIVKFGAKRIKRILSLCLVMDRAQCLYKMKKDGPFPVGMHWYALQHEQSNKYNTEGFRSWNDPTISRHYMYLIEMEDLGLKGDPWLERLVKPHRRIESKEP